MGDTDFVYVVLTGVTSCLSMFGCTALTSLYFCRRRKQTAGRRLLVFLCLADFLTALGNLLGVCWYSAPDSIVINRLVFCRAQTGLTIFSSIASFSWMVIISVSLYVTIVRLRPGFIKRYGTIFHLIAWPLPGIIVIVALASNVLGYDQDLDQATWCWIDPRVPNALVWQFATGKFWEILAYVATVVLYAMIKVFLWKRTKKSTIVGRRRNKTSVIMAANRKLTFVPLVFIVLRLWGTVRFLLGNFAMDIVDKPYISWIVPLQGIGDSAQGFANFVLYCFSTVKIRRRLAILMCGGRQPRPTTLLDTTRKATVSVLEERIPAQSASTV